LAKRDNGEPAARAWQERASNQLNEAVERLASIRARTIDGFRQKARLALFTEESANDERPITDFSPEQSGWNGHIIKVGGG
jgi:hypothetical protein